MMVVGVVSEWVGGWMEDILICSTVRNQAHHRNVIIQRDKAHIQTRNLTSNLLKA